MVSLMNVESVSTLLTDTLHDVVKWNLSVGTPWKTRSVDRKDRGNERNRQLPAISCLSTLQYSSVSHEKNGNDREYNHRLSLLGRVFCTCSGKPRLRQAGLLLLEIHQTMKL